MSSEEKISDVLNFWFGHVEETIVPSENRARIWFGESDEIDEQIKTQYKDLLDAAMRGECSDWEKSARGRLALIILLDQFSRHIYRKTPQAFEQDKKALSICLEGIKKEADHDLSLIERVFYYFPLLHAENIELQEQSIQSYQVLSELAFSETRVIYDSFLKFANHHYVLIQRFGRFPQRNKLLGRESTLEETAYLIEIGNDLDDNK